MAEIDRYKLSESTDSLVVLRGHDFVGPKVAEIAGGLLILASAYPIYYLVATRFEVGALGAVVGAWVIGLVLIIWARVRRSKPDRKTYVDLGGQRLWTSTFGEATEPLPFSNLGTLKLGKVSWHDARSRTSRSIAAVTFSQHEGYVLYVPWSNADMVRYVNALRELVGEQHLPRAK